MSLIRFDQLRISTGTGAAYPGLQALNDSGGAGESSLAIKLQSSKGLAVGTNGVALDEAGTYSLSFGANASWTFTGGQLAVSGSSFSSTSVPNADWVLSTVATGVIWRYPVLMGVGVGDVQLDSTGDALRQAIAFYLDGQPAAADTFTISDGVTTETWTFQTGAETAAFQVQIGGTTDLTMLALGAAITADSTLWDTGAATGLNSINDGSGTSTAGRVIVIYRTVQLDAKADRIYGSFATPANAQYVNFNGQPDATSYSYNVSSQLPATDPAQKEFGPGVITASLTAGEAHVDLNADQQYIWDADGGTWVQISGTGSITAGIGLTKTGNTIDIGSATGIIDGINRTANNIAAATADGVRVAANYITLLLEASAPGTGGLVLNGTSPNKELAVNAGDGILLDANGVGVDIGTTSGLVLTGTSPNKELFVDPSDGIGLDANGVRTNTATAAGAQQYGGLVATRTSDGTGAASAGAGYLAVATDNTTLEVNASNQVIVKALGIDTAQLAANAVTIAKLGIQFNEETFAASAFSYTTYSSVALGATALVDSNAYGYVENYRNGVADMTKLATGVDPSTAVQFAVTASLLKVGTDITASGNTYRVRYLSAL